MIKFAFIRYKWLDKLVVWLPRKRWPHFFLPQVSVIRELFINFATAK